MQRWYFYKCDHRYEWLIGDGYVTQSPRVIEGNFEGAAQSTK